MGLFDWLKGSPARPAKRDTPTAEEIDAEFAKLPPEEQEAMRRELEAQIHDVATMRRDLAAAVARKSGFHPDDDSPLFDSPSGVRTFFSRIAGVTHGDRQRIVSSTPPGTRLDLIPEPDNPVDIFAIKVCRGDGQQLGYLPAELARELSLKVDLRIEAQLMQVTGGRGKKTNFGANLKITVALP